MRIALRGYQSHKAESCGGQKTNLRSVTWTKVSLNEAKMRATPKTSSPSRTWGPSCKSRQYGVRWRACRRNAAFSGASYLDVLLRTALDLISSHFAVVAATEDAAEALAAMKEKRTPQYRGR